MKFAALLSALATTLALMAVPAQAETAFIKQAHNTPNGDLDLSAMLGTYALIGYEYGVKAAYRIVPKGFIEALNDSVSLDVGVFKGRWYLLDETLVSASMRWDFHVSRRWTVYGAPNIYVKRTELAGDYELITSTSTTGVAMQAGGFLHFDDAFALRLEWDTADAALRVGTTIKI